MREASGALPHDHLYTRLRPSRGRGIGVFAIRDIPQGIDPFVGEGTGSALVPRSVVEALADPAVRQMYVDFCPLIDEHYLAPITFNRLTTAWYMNHSDEPNVTADRGANFVATRRIGAGEELTVCYRTFSSHADPFIALWDKGARDEGGEAQGRPD